MNINDITVTTYNRLKSNIALVNPLSILSNIGFIGVVENIMTANADDEFFIGEALTEYARVNELTDETIFFATLHGGGVIPLMHVINIKEDWYGELINAAVGDMVSMLQLTGVYQSADDVFNDVKIKLTGPIGQPVLFNPDKGEFYEATVRPGKVMSPINIKDIKAHVKTSIKALSALADSWCHVRESELAYSGRKNASEAVLELVYCRHNEQQEQNVIDLIKGDS